MSIYLFEYNNHTPETHSYANIVFVRWNIRLITIGRCVCFCVCRILLRSFLFCFVPIIHTNDSFQNISQVYAIHIEILCSDSASCQFYDKNCLLISFWCMMDSSEAFISKKQSKQFWNPSLTQCYCIYSFIETYKIEYSLHRCVTVIHKSHQS